MDSIDADVLEQASQLLATLDENALGYVHTVTLTLDGHSGGCLMKVESARAGDVTLVIR